MKFFFAIISGSIIASSAFAQNVTFGASGNTHPIQYSLDGVTLQKAPVGNPSMIPGLGELNIGFFVAAAHTSLSYDSSGLPDFSGWTPVSTVLHQIAPIAGNVPSVNLTLPANVATSGSDVEFEVVGWTGTATSWLSAEENGATMLAWAGSGYSGGALGWDQMVGSSTAPQVLVTGTGGFNGLVFETPEPSTFALLGIGVAGLALLRKKKRSFIQK